MHGLLDTPAVFRPLQQLLAGRRPDLLLPALPMRFGLTPVREAALLLQQHIEALAPGSAPVDVLGFSMGGVIARTWIQQLGGQRRTRRFISLGSPQQGTWTAQPGQAGCFQAWQISNAAVRYCRSSTQTWRDCAAWSATAFIRPLIWPCCRAGVPSCPWVQLAPCRWPPIHSCCGIQRLCSLWSRNCCGAESGLIQLDHWP